MRYALAAFVALLAVPAEAQPSFLEGIYLEAGPSATVGAGSGADWGAGPGLSVEAGWSGSRLAFFAGGTGGFVTNSPALWDRIRDPEARLQAQDATRSSLATLDYGIEYHFANPNSAVTPFIGVSGVLPIYAAESRDANERVSVSGHGLSARFGLQRDLSRGVAVSASVATFVGSFDRGFVGEEMTGRSVEVERGGIRGVHTKLGIMLRPGAMLAPLGSR